MRRRLTLGSLALMTTLPLVAAQTEGADTETGGSGLFLIAVLAIVGVLVGLAMVYAWRFQRCPSDKILVIYGITGSNAAGGTRAAECIHGGGKFVIPLVQDYAYLDLKPMTIDIPLKNALSQQNIRVDVPSTFTIGISTTPEVMQNAAERLLGLSLKDIEDMAREIIFGQLRLTIATLTIEQINQDRDEFNALIAMNVEPELNKVGLYLINVNIADIYDEADYIKSIGMKAAAEAIATAKVDVANAERDGDIGESDAVRERTIRVAENEAQAEKGRKAAEADQRIFVQEQEAVAVSGENESRARIAETNANLAEAEATARQRSEVAQRLADVKIQQAQFDLETERLRAEEIAREEIAKQQIVIASEAEAERQRQIARGEADAILAKYNAEAEGTEAVLAAKARGYEALVQAANGDARSAATLLMVEKLESIVAQQAKAISNLKIDKITVWDSAGGSNEGSSTSNFVSSLYQSLPPFHDVARMAGIDLPDYLGSMAEETKTE